MTDSTRIEPVLLDELPPLHQPFYGGNFVGVSTDATGQHFAVALLPDREGVKTWRRAVHFAEGLSGQLPTRAVAAMLVHRELALPRTGFWTADQADSTRAYMCAPGDGVMVATGITATYLALVVRLVPLYQPLGRDALERRLQSLESRLHTQDLLTRVAALESAAAR